MEEILMVHFLPPSDSELLLSDFIDAVNCSICCKCLKTGHLLRLSNGFIRIVLFNGCHCVSESKWRGRLVVVLYILCACQWTRYCISNNVKTKLSPSSARANCLFSTVVQWVPMLFFCSHQWTCDVTYFNWQLRQCLDIDGSLFALIIMGKKYMYCDGTPNWMGDCLGP